MKFDIEVLKESLPIIIAFVISEIKSDKADIIIREVKESITSIDLETPPEKEEAFSALFNILDELADLSENTELDDMLVSLAETVVSGGGIRIIDIFKARRKARKERKANK